MIRSKGEKEGYVEETAAPKSERCAWARLERIMGRGALDRLASSTVMVLGLGGVGSNCVEALARGGVGNFVVVDHDVVQASNINRQAIAFFSTIGRKKAYLVKEMIADINPAAKVETLDTFVYAKEVPLLLGKYGGRVDYVIDALDTISTKIALAEYADQKSIRFISSMGAGNKLHPECFKVADVYDTVNCPLCRVMRKEGRKRGIKHLRVIYSSELPVAVPVKAGTTRRERSNLGTASYVPPIMGQMIAGEVIRELAGFQE